jgi:hypothetical protein
MKGRRLGCREFLAGVLFAGGATALVIHGLRAMTSGSAVAQIRSGAARRPLPVPVEGWAAQVYGVAAMVMALALVLFGIGLLNPDEEKGKRLIAPAIAALIIAFVLFLVAVSSRI